MKPARIDQGFDPTTVSALDEPVRRYLTHAPAAGAPRQRGIRLQPAGRIRVGAWLRFTSVWEGDGRSFSWRATAGPGSLPLLRVHDRFGDGAGSMDIRLRSLKLLHAENADPTRSGAGRAALEALRPAPITTADAGWGGAQPGCGRLSQDPRPRESGASDGVSPPRGRPPPARQPRSRFARASGLDPGAAYLALGVGSAAT